MVKVQVGLGNIASKRERVKILFKKSKSSVALFKKSVCNRLNSSRNEISLMIAGDGNSLKNAVKVLCQESKKPPPQFLPLFITVQLCLPLKRRMLRQPHKSHNLTVGVGKVRPRVLQSTGASKRQKRALSAPLFLASSPAYRPFSCTDAACPNTAVLIGGAVEGCMCLHVHACILCSHGNFLGLGAYY